MRRGREIVADYTTPATTAAMLPPGHDWRPDFSDPATLGALLGAVREAYPGWPIVCLQYRGTTESWQVIGRRREYRERHDNATLGDGDTEFAALCAAWGARPGRGA